MNNTIGVYSYQQISSTDGSFTVSLQTTDKFGYSLTTISDINNDDIDDLIVGALRDKLNSLYKGAIYVLLLQSNAKIDTYIKISQTTGGFTTAILNTYEYFGSAVSNMLDINNHMISDICVGSIGNDDGNTNAGAVYIISLKTTGFVKTFIKISSTEGSFNENLGSYDTFGSSICGLKDIDGDEISDIGVGSAHYDDNLGAVYLLMLKTNYKVKTFIKISKTSGGMTNADLLLDDDYSSTIIFGGSISLIGGNNDDLDGDNIYDIICGAPQDNDPLYNEGALYIMFMKTNNNVKTFVKISNTSGSFTAYLDTLNYFGQAISSISDWGDADIDGDNIQDILVGSDGDSDNFDGTNQGSIYIIMLKTSGLVKTYSKISSTTGSFNDILQSFDYLGSSVSSFGEDLNGNGYLDIVIGAYGRNDVYVISLHESSTNNDDDDNDDDDDDNNHQIFTAVGVTFLIVGGFLLFIIINYYYKKKMKKNDQSYLLFDNKSINTEYSNLDDAETA